MLTLKSRPRTLSNLDRIPVPPTARWQKRALRSRWKPIQHGRVARTLLRQAEAIGVPFYAFVALLLGDR